MTYIPGGGGGGGEANTATNVGTAGIGPVDGKVGVDLQFRKFNVGSLFQYTLDAPNQHTDLNLTDFSALSILARAVNSLGQPALLLAAADDRVLRRVGGVLDFGQFTVGMAPANLWTFAKLQQIATQTIAGRNTAATGDIEAITATQVLDWLSSTRGAMLTRGAAAWGGLGPSATVNASLVSAGAGADLLYRKMTDENYYAAHVQGGGGLTPWYILGANNNSSLIAGAVTANTLYATPFVAPARGGTLDRIAFAVTTLLAGNARVGIYNSTSDTNLYPSSLVVDGGSISTATTGAKTATISQALTPGALYWAAYLGDAAVTVRCHQAGTVSHILGTDSGLISGGSRGIQVALAFAALPATFTAGAALTVSGTQFPAVFGRYGA